MDLDASICTALVNREITHSSFRLYLTLRVALDGCGEDFSEIYVDGLKAVVPGVKGKPLGDGALRENLRELERLGLIEMAGRRWSKYRIHLRLKPVDADGSAADKLRERILVPPDLTWGISPW